MAYQYRLLERIFQASGPEETKGTRSEGMPAVLAFESDHRVPLSSCETHTSPVDGGLALRVVTPWVDGAPLSRMMVQKASTLSHLHEHIPFGDALNLLTLVAECIESLSHLVDGTVMVHQDIKPSNIVISTGFGGNGLHVSIVDYDTAVFLDDPSDAVSCGTCGYAAPETVLHGSSHATDTSDIFSFGVLACEVLTGIWPYPISRLLAHNGVFWRQYYGEGGGVRVDPTIPSNVRTLLEACVSIDPSSRPLPAELVSAWRDLARDYKDSAVGCPLSHTSDFFAMPTPLRTVLA